MTQQIKDEFRYDGEEYAVIAISSREYRFENDEEEIFFDPKMLKLCPGISSTACWRGYLATYTIMDTRLVVAELRLNLFEPGEGFRRKQGPSFGEITPTDPQDGWSFNNYYQNLNYPLEYTGGLLIANGWNPVLNEFPEFPFPREFFWSALYSALYYERVVELIFKRGILIETFDHSQEIAEIREFVKVSERERQEDSENWYKTAQERLSTFHDLVKHSFSKSYDFYLG